MKEEIPGVKLGMCKARIFSRVFTLRGGINYNEVFSPLIKNRSIMILLATVAKFDLELELMDVKTTCLYRELKEVTYMRQPAVYEV